MDYKVQNIIKWWEQYSKEKLVIKSKTQEFELDLKRERLSIKTIRHRLSKMTRVLESLIFQGIIF